MAEELTREILDALGAAFPEDEIEFLPRAQSGGKALGLPYIDARSVMRRLDAVVGPAGWRFDFDVLSPDGKMVKGRLTVLGVEKCDAGEASQEDEPLKSAVSDALKRCAVHFGIGRYLYYLPKVWAPFDAQKRRFTEPPRLDRAAVERALQICGIQPPAPSLPSRPAAPPSAPVSPLVCSRVECGERINEGQRTVSVERFGAPLCPTCQKRTAPAAATAPRRPPTGGRTHPAARPV